MSAAPAGNPNFEFPYEGEIKGIIDEFREYQTRVMPENSSEVEEIDLDYGWKAVLYRKEEGLAAKILDNLSYLTAYNVDYARRKPEYEWELRTPDGEKFWSRGLDIEPEKFEEKVRDFLAGD